LNEIEHCFNDDEMKYLEQKLNDKKWVLFIIMSLEIDNLFLIEYGLALRHYCILLKKHVKQMVAHVLHDSLKNWK
jgi:hypothetical protein